MTIFTAGSFSCSSRADRSVRQYQHTLIVYISVEFVHVIVFNHLIVSMFKKDERTFLP